MKRKLFGIAIAALAAGFVAFGGSQSAFAACREDIAAVQAAIDQEQDADKKQKATEELVAAQTSADSQDEDACNNHVKAAQEHLKKK